MTTSEAHAERTTKTAEAAPRDRPSASMDRRQAQEALLVLGSLGQLLTEAIGSRVDRGFAGNAEVIVVTYLDVSGPLRPADVVSATGMSSGGVTKLLDRLENGGYIRREYGTFLGDRRVSILSLTPDGEQLAREYADAVLAVEDAVRDAAARLCSTAS
ncbi:MAG: MarR family transcriptional regulator [Candidatus Eisenbacteria bacterium]|nr:MarR family transcriptional regulator [Candidatus Eisenbacteria bacterium]